MVSKEQSLPLQRVYQWEHERAHDVYLTQPMEGGAVRDYTWAQAVGEARRMAAYLKAKGWEPGTRIGILSKNCAWWIMSDLAIWMAGYVSVPLYPTLTAESVRQVLDHSEAKACFIGKLDEWPQMKSGVPDSVHCISFPASPKNDYATWDDIVKKTAPIEGNPTRAADELATIIYTSGTTGMPKGVMHSFNTFSVAASTVADSFDITPNERMLSHLPLSHVAERWAIEAGSFYCGFRIFFAESLDTFARDLRSAKPTVFATVPRLWTKFQQGVFAKMPKKRLDFLFSLPLLGGVFKKKILKAVGFEHTRFAMGGAAPMPPSLINWYRSLGLELLEAYGMTENFGMSHGSMPGEGRVGYVGKPWPGVECKLSEIGEVLVRSPSNMLGYFREPEKTREVLSEDGWLKTGDLGAFDEAGRLRITGRAKEIFKTSKGKYVAPAPIESKLSALSAIEALCVAGANYGQPCALVMLAPDAAKQDRASLTAQLKAQLETVNATLDPHEQLDFLVVVKDNWTVENGFITPTLKIKRNVVEAAYGPFLEAWYKHRQPVIWQE
ncbi:AMP-binding protein [Stenotrophobium rhamnosiphilum]|uniref:AMP-binding protein n=1 Tax=Stenotrophobium rhamnosiphilum TaxID=2029166 RepID=UPI0019D237FF|nr:AMP-binding protein [Stenotrophobium rhamnosiphilum]